MPKQKLFSQGDQINARRNGSYDQIAAQAEAVKCVFCDLRKKYILKERDGLVLTVNIFPYIDGQLMVIPRRHVENFTELTQEEVVTNFELTKEALGVLKKQMNIQGVWMILRDGQKGGVSGKTVKHLHWNIMPYVDGINTWHYQELTITPVDLATRLRPFINDE